MKKYKKIHIRFGTADKTIDKMEEAFNQLGSEGWEYKDHAGAGIYFIFDREN